MADTFKQAARKVDKIQKSLERQVPKEAKEGMEDTAEALRRHLVTQGTTATGRLWESIEVVPTPGAGKVMFTLRIVGAPYWKYVEFGTGIHTQRGYMKPTPMPPIRPIWLWITKKGITPRPGSPYDSQMELAEGIQESIGRKGTRSHPFARPVWRGPKGKQHIDRKIDGAVEKSIGRPI